MSGMNRVVVAPEDLMSIPVGSLISVGRRLSGDDVERADGDSVWHVIAEGKGMLVNGDYPGSETEDLDWFEPWEVVVLPLSVS